MKPYILTQARDQNSLNAGFKNLEGSISLKNDFVSKGIAIPSISIHLDNIYEEDIDFVIKQIELYRKLLTT